MTKLSDIFSLSSQPQKKGPSPPPEDCFECRVTGTIGVIAGALYIANLTHNGTIRRLPGISFVASLVCFGISIWRPRSTDDVYSNNGSPITATVDRKKVATSND